jgi:hypothetical protein
VLEFEGLGLPGYNYIRFRFFINVVLEIMIPVIGQKGYIGQIQE